MSLNPHLVKYLHQKFKENLDKQLHPNLMITNALLLTFVKNFEHMGNSQASQLENFLHMLQWLQEPAMNLSFGNNWKNKKNLKPLDLVNLRRRRP